MPYTDSNDESDFTLKVCRRIGGVHSGMPHAPANTFIYGGAPDCRAHAGLFGKTEEYLTRVLINFKVQMMV